MRDAIWCLRATVQDSGPFCTELACRFAEAVLGYFESEFPDDDRPRKAIEAARSGDAEAARRAALAALLASRRAASSAAADALSAAAALAAGAAWSALAARAAALAAGAAASAHAADAAALAAGAAASALADHAAARAALGARYYEARIEARQRMIFTKLLGEQKTADGELDV